MHAILLLTLISNPPEPIQARVEGVIDLSTLSIAQARDLTGSRRKVAVWRCSWVDEVEGTKLFDAWHARDVHCLVRLVEGEKVPAGEQFTVEGFIRVWDVPPYWINGKWVAG